MKRLLLTLLLTACAPATAAELYIDGILVPEAEVRITTTQPADPVPAPRPPPVPRPPTSSCSAEGLVCAYHVSSADWHSSRRTSATVVIPKGKTVVSQFTTSSDENADYGRFSFTTPVSGIRQAVDLWVATELGGEPVSKGCLLERTTYAYVLRTTSFFSRYCALEPDTVHYLHIKHTDPSDPPSKIIRELTTG